MSSIFFDAAPTSGVLVCLLLALLVALGFEFVNGFNDTANAVATVIYTKSMRPAAAVVLAGVLNFVGVLAAGVGVAYSIVNMFPVDMVEGSGTTGFAMVFAVLLGAILWNLGTWYLGLPSSSSHAMIGAIMGVGVAHSLVTPGMSLGQGVHWEMAQMAGAALFFSPLIGFVFSGLVLLGLKKVVSNPEAHRSPEGPGPPPFWMRAVLILGCSGVSFAHGTNDGQKGMGLLMLILIGLVPAAFAIKMDASAAQLEAIVRTSRPLEAELAPIAGSATVPGTGEEQAQAATRILNTYLEDHHFSPEVAAAMLFELVSIRESLSGLTSLTQVPPAQRWELRAKGMQLLRVMRLIRHDPAASSLTPEQKKLVKIYKSPFKGLIEYVSPWVKVAVGIALGLGTMVGWRRIVVTVGEKIGRTRLTYSQGAAAQTVAVATILMADRWGMPVSTTHILSSGIAGTMFTNRSGLQMKTLRSILLAWVLTLPSCCLLSALLFMLLRQI